MGIIVSNVLITYLKPLAYFTISFVCTGNPATEAATVRGKGVSFNGPRNVVDSLVVGFGA